MSSATDPIHTHAWGTQPEMFGPRHEYRLAIFTRETAKLAPASKVLDAAIGLGQLAGRLEKQGHRVFGIDYSFDAALHARRTTGAKPVVGDLTLLPFRDGAFDAVTSGETLEHLDDDEEAIAEIGRVVRSGGRCVVTVPALRSLWTKSDDYYEHKRRYGRDELAAIFESASFRVERASFWGFPIVLVYDYVFLLPMNLRRARRDVASDAALRGVATVGRAKWLVRLVQAIFSADRFFAFVPFGPGLLLVGVRR
ncbi:MAG: methyltransferase domain-containing protein [Thermoanaerobaculia bacterium]|nr:methyltransferase domain-containing protein [Thermoanaerobaculia bacterium]